MNKLYMSEIIHFFEYLEYDDLEELKLTYTKPVKKENQIYIAYLDSPIKFYLPKSEIIDIYQDDFGTNIAKYLINIDDHVEFLTFLENLDSICINHAATNSEIWFNKTLSTNTLVKYYNTLYNLEEDDDNIEEMTVDLELDNNDLIDLLNEYNRNDNLNIVIKIVGIEFFKQTFRWKIIIENIINGFDDEDIESNDSQLNFNDLVTSNKETSLELRLNNNRADNLSDITDKEQEENKQMENNKESEELVSDIENNKNTVNNILEDKSIEKNTEEEVNSNTQNNTDKISIISDSRVINNDVISELAKTDETNNKIDKLEKDTISEQANTSVNIDTNTLDEIKSIINEKKLEAEKYYKNAERAKKASDSLTKKGDDISIELSNYEEKLKVLSQNLSL